MASSVRVGLVAVFASVMMAATCAREVGAAVTHALDEFARAIGLAFQIQDDLLDIEGDVAELLGPGLQPGPVFLFLRGRDLRRPDRHRLRV